METRSAHHRLRLHTLISYSLIGGLGPSGLVVKGGLCIDFVQEPGKPPIVSWLIKQAPALSEVNPLSESSSWGRFLRRPFYVGQDKGLESNAGVVVLLLNQLKA